MKEYWVRELVDPNYYATSLPIYFIRNVEGNYPGATIGYILSAPSHYKFGDPMYSHSGIPEKVNDRKLNILEIVTLKLQGKL